MWGVRVRERGISYHYLAISMSFFLKFAQMLLAGSTDPSHLAKLDPSLSPATNYE